MEWTVVDGIDEHGVATVELAMELADELALDTEEVFIFDPTGARYACVTSYSTDFFQ